MEDKVLDELARSPDPVDQELVRVLRSYQRIRASRNLIRSVGREPAAIRQLGAVEVITRRVRSGSSGFDEVPVRESYESIVATYPDRFDPETLAIARQRIGVEEDMFAPTADPDELDRRVRILLDRTTVPYPAGVKNPVAVQGTVIQFLRDPRVKAYVLKRAVGRCEGCKSPAPFRTTIGLDFLEVHHVKALAEGGSDTISNAVAVCPNCHRALHYAADRDTRKARLFENVGSQLIAE